MEESVKKVLFPRALARAPRQRPALASSMLAASPLYTERMIIAARHQRGNLETSEDTSRNVIPPPNRKHHTYGQHQQRIHVSDLDILKRHLVHILRCATHFQPGLFAERGPGPQGAWI